MGLQPNLGMFFAAARPSHRAAVLGGRGRLPPPPDVRPPSTCFFRARCRWAHGSCSPDLGTIPPPAGPRPPPSREECGSPACPSFPAIGAAAGQASARLSKLRARAYQPPGPRAEALPDLGSSCASATPRHRDPWPPSSTFENVSKRFGGLIAVDNCSLEVERGSITGLIGPNGAGKSTLFNIVAGNIAPDTGRIVFDGEDVTGLPPHELFAPRPAAHLPDRARILEHDGAGEPDGGAARPAGREPARTPGSAAARSRRAKREVRQQGRRRHRFPQARPRQERARRQSLAAGRRSCSSSAAP